jgi:hypothetical protein
MISMTRSRFHAVVDKIRVATKTPDVPTFSILGPKLREIGEQFSAIDQVESKRFGNDWIVRRNVAHDFL